MENFRITIGRQYGSGGKEIGRILSRKLGIPFYGKEELMKIATAGKQSAVCNRYETGRKQSRGDSISENQRTLRRPPLHSYREMRKLYLPG